MTMKTVKSKTVISSGAAGDVVAQMESDVYEGEKLDTRISIAGEWWVSGDKRTEFCEKLCALIDEYRI